MTMPALKSRRNGATGLLLAAATFAMMARTHAGEPALNVAAADTVFGFRLLEAVQRASPRVNVVLSPVSAALDLSMVLNAASDQTKHEMLAMLALEGSELDAINAANSGLLQVIGTPVKDVTLSVADSLWVNSRRGRLRADYVQPMQTDYDAHIETVDFHRPGTVTRINEWASQATNGRISTVIDRLEPADLAVLLNAVYFKGQWTYPFDPAHTQARNFTLADGTMEQTPRMSQTGHFDYFETPDMQALRLPFGEGNLLMDVLLPATASSLAALEKQLTAEHWRSWGDRYVPRSGTVELPRFELKTSYRLNEALQHLGMVRAFQPNGAQFEGMLEPEAGHAPSAGFYISSVLQSTDWKVDETGAEAAAVTTIGVRAAAVMRPVQPFQMIIDRPFFCAIEDRRSGALLFVAAIYDPAR